MNHTAYGLKTVLLREQIVLDEIKEMNLWENLKLSRHIKIMIF
jgi:hypothetical protein